ncbi:hypothetical protein CsSME_00038763 [Camellia sinensis var. sinensis]
MLKNLRLEGYIERERKNIIKRENGVICENLRNLIHFDVVYGVLTCWFVLLSFIDPMIVLMWADLLAGYTMWMMMLYLTNVWKLNFTHAAAIINVFCGLTATMLLPMQFLVDAFLGNYWMLLISSFAYSAVSFSSSSQLPKLSVEAINA